ncbi:amidase [Cupriavidus sp. IK-TO18]|nr:amidase [Cupriavidus sp. IK-TO18]
MSTCHLPTSSEPWRWHATEISAAIHAGHVSSAEVVESVYARIESVNPSLNAIVHMDRDRALASAAIIDRQRSQGRAMGPLSGVPVSIKLNVDVQGEATTNGTPLWKARIAPDDSAVVTNLRRAGAIVIGRTNTPPHSFRWFTENTLHGRTTNPWMSSVTSGGSSGGAGVCVAAGMGPIAHGTDIAGSIRYPAYVNGVVGLRATPGRIPAHHPTTPQRFFGLQAMSAQGPLARSIADARLALEAMAAGGGVDPLWVDSRMHYGDDRAPVRVALVDEIRGVELDPPVLDALRKAAAALTAAGYQVERVSMPDLDRGVDIWQRIVMTECKFGMIAAADAIGDPNISISVHNMARCAPEVDLAGYAQAIADRDNFRREWCERFAQYPLALLPTSCHAPLPWGSDLGSVAEMKALLRVQSPLIAVAASGLPGLHVPTGVADGLPVGVQLVAGSFREMRLLNAGEIIETECGHLNEVRWTQE